MTEFATLSCLSCGKELRINLNFNSFVCGHCGCEHIVKREYGTISLVPVVKENPYSGEKECHVCKGNAKNRRELPDMHRCRICQFWTCNDCLSSIADSWVCRECRP
jgi:hypothetical protein